MIRVNELGEEIETKSSTRIFYYLKAYATGKWELHNIIARKVDFSILDTFLSHKETRYTDVTLTPAGALILYAELMKNGKNN